MERMNLMYIVMRKNVFSLALLFSASLMASCNQIGSYVQTTVSKTVADANNEVNAYDYKDSKEHGAVVERSVQVAPLHRTHYRRTCQSGLYSRRGDQGDHSRQ